MEKIKYNINLLVLIGSLMAIGVSCTKEDSGTLALKRMFMPAKITTTSQQTQALISWTASLFTTGDASYVVQISMDSVNFDPILLNDTTLETSITVTDKDVPIKQKFYARVKALGTKGAADSNWEVSSSFKITGEQLLLQVQSADLIDRSVILRWGPSPDFTQIVITPSGGGTPIVVTLNSSQSLAGNIQVDNLTGSTSYTAQIFKGSLDKGTITFITKAGDVFGVNTIIDLRGIIGKPSILIDTLPDIPSGSVVLLKRGQFYTVTPTSGFAFNKSVTILSGLDFGTNLATIKLTTNFTVAAGSTIDSIVFKDVIFKGSRGSNSSFDNDYIINTSSSVTPAVAITNFKLDNCTVKILRGTVRLQAGGAGVKITNYTINNCVIDSIREYGVATASNLSSFTNIKVTNSTIYRLRRFIDHRVTGTSSLVVSNCTFNEVPSGGPISPPAANPSNWLIDYNAFTVTSGINITNCVFGKTWNEGLGDDTGGRRAVTGTTVNIVNSYNATDFMATNTNFALQLLGLNPYSGASTTLYSNVPANNFTLNSSFSGKSTTGDPRWRQ